MAWIVPPTFSTSQVLSALDLTTLSDDQSYLVAKPHAAYTQNAGADLTTTSTTFEDVDTTNWSLSLTTVGGDVLVGLNAAGPISTVNGRVFFDIELDGVRVGGDDGLWAAETDGNESQNQSGLVLLTGVSSAAHTITLQWRTTTAATATMYAGAGTSDGDIHPQFFVQEI